MMPSTFRTRPSQRREPSPTAKWLVLGHPATPILHEGRTAHLLPVESRHHRKRYATGQRLAVKEYVPGPTECHVILTGVLGPASQPRPFYLGHVDYATARELGFVRLDDFQANWVLNHDTDWYARADEKAAQDSVKPDEVKGANELLFERTLQRFEQRWKFKLAWLLHFRLEVAQSAPRLLAASAEPPTNVVLGADNRWHYQPREDERESDRGYTSSDSRALAGEMACLTDAEHALHVGPQSHYRAQDRLAAKRAEREAKGWQDRLSEARRAARAKGSDVRDECRRFDRLMEQGKTEKALTQLALIEARAFPVAA